MTNVKDCKVTHGFKRNFASSEATNREENFNHAPECSAHEEIFEFQYPIQSNLSIRTPLRVTRAVSNVPTKFSYISALKKNLYNTDSL